MPKKVLPSKNKPRSATKAIAGKSQGFIGLYETENGVNDFTQNGSDTVYFGKTVNAACKNFNENECNSGNIEVYELVYVGTFSQNNAVTFKKL
jgi:hypothetical protein